MPFFFCSSSKNIKNRYRQPWGSTLTAWGKIYFTHVPHFSSIFFFAILTFIDFRLWNDFNQAGKEVRKKNSKVNYGRRRWWCIVSFYSILSCLLWRLKDRTKKNLDDKCFTSSLFKLFCFDGVWWHGIRIIERNKIYIRKRT